MLLTKTLRSSTLKLALIYVVLFSAAIFGLLFFVYRSTLSTLRDISDRALMTEEVLFSRAYERGGRDGVVALIERRLNDPQFAGWVYLLADEGLRRIVGNLTLWPAPDRGSGEWSPLADLDVRPSAEAGRVSRASWRVFPNGDSLFLGRRLEAVGRFTATMAAAVGATAGLFLVLAAAAGISTAGRSVTRIEMINATSREIMRSGLGKRIPLRGSGDDWDELAANLNSMLDRIEELVEANRQVSDNIAHDLRTPLTRMRTRLERAATQPLEAVRYRSVVNETIGELDGVLRTFSSLLRISRIEGSDRGGAFPRLDLYEIAEEVVELFDPAAEENAVRLLLSGKGPIPVAGDRDLLFDAVSNLVDNAIAHGGKGGEVTVSIACSAEGAVLCVADRGPGIPPAERQRVFRRFYRLEHSRNSPGNGLGLSLVAAVASLHGAQIAMSDNAPGLRVELHFPSSLSLSPFARFGE